MILKIIFLRSSMQRWKILLKMRQLHFSILGRCMSNGAFKKYKRNTIALRSRQRLSSGSQLEFNCLLFRSPHVLLLLLCPPVHQQAVDAAVIVIKYFCYTSHLIFFDVSTSLSPKQHNNQMHGSLENINRKIRCLRSDLHKLLVCARPN